MNSLLRQYLFGAVFIGVSTYEALRGYYLTMTFYGLVGLAFVINALTREPKMAAYKGVLVIILWTLVVGAAIVGVYVVKSFV